MRVLVAGATGYIGGRLVPRLLDAGHQVRCLTRSPEKLIGVAWADRVDIVLGDVVDGAGLDAALDGVEIVVYLVHSIASDDDFASADRNAALNIANASARFGVRRIIYLGGLIPQRETASPHLASRAEVGQILLDGPVPAIVLQAGVIIGSGSASFEMLRYLTERLPIMVTPKWVNSRIQPIAVRDVLTYLMAMIGLDGQPNRRFDIGGPEVMTYLDMMRRYAEVAGLRRRLIVPIPILTPRLSSHWVNVVTPVPRALARPLIESLKNSVVVHDHDIETLVPLERTPYDEAVRLALASIREGRVVTRWSGADWPGAPSDPMPTDPKWTGGSAYRDERSMRIGASRRATWRAVEGIGGEHGWYSLPLAWAVRGLIDRLAGGVGLRRGRRDPDHLTLGDVVDFWRVEEIDHGRLLRLRAEMRLPGGAWLEWRIEDSPDGPVLNQRALFVPTGLAGQLYWWSVWPFHGVVFSSMLRNLANAAEEQPGFLPTA